MPWELDTECMCPTCRRERTGEDEPEYAPRVRAGKYESHIFGVHKLDKPLVRMLRNGGRKWSAEVEVNGIDYEYAARHLGCEVEGYGSSPSRAGSVCSTPDATVDAEIKLSRMSDGNEAHAAICRGVYTALRDAGAACTYDTGHHVHVDAERIADLGSYTATEVVVAAATIGAACRETLKALAASGYARHRSENGNSYGGEWQTGEWCMNDRFALHGSNTMYAINYDRPSRATVEYRLPNGTAFAERAHAHVAIPLGLLDLAEAAVIDGDAEAREALQAARDKVGASADRYSEAPSFDEVTGAAFLARNLRLHADSFEALRLAAETSPATAGHRAVWRKAASGKLAAV